jgi:pilus assembly protein CpaE
MNSDVRDGFSAMRRELRRNLAISLAGGSAEEQIALRSALAALDDFRMVVGEVSAPGQTPPHDDALRVLILILDSDAVLWQQELGPWVESGAWEQVIALARHRTPEAVRAALSAGASEVLFMPPDAVDLARSLLKICDGDQVRGRGAEKAAYAIVSVSGGVGVSSLTVALGLALRRLTARQVALLDLGMQSDSLAPILDLQTAHSVVELADPTSAVDTIRLESAVAKHVSGLYLLAAPPRIEDCEMVSPSTVETTVGVMLQLFDYVLIDCGHHISEASVTAWERAGGVFYVLDQSITAVHAAHRFIDLFDRLSLKHVALDLIINHYRPSHVISLEKIQSALNRPIAFCIPHDERAMAIAEAQGDGLFSLPASSPMLLAVTSLAQALLGVAEASNGRRKPGVFSRLFGSIER